MRILAIDQSYSHSALCIVEGTNLVDFLVLSTTKDKEIYDRALDIARGVSQAFDLYKPHKIIIEGLAFGIKGNATRDLAGLLFTIITTLKYQHSFHNFEIIAPNVVKKTATGSGKATKKEMIAALPVHIRQRFSEQGYKLTTGLADLADAYWLSQCVS